MSALLIFISVSLLVGAGFFYSTALEEVRPNFPLGLQDQPLARVALDYLFWDRAISVRARRRYFISLIMAELSFIFVAINFIVTDRFMPVIFFAGLSVFFLGHILKRWIQYRDRL